MKVVGITCSTGHPEGRPVNQALNNAYVRAVENAGAAPLILPNTHDPAVISRYLGVLDGLLLSGGVDVSPARYGEEDHPKLGEVDFDRDALEMGLIPLAVEQDVPIFAICRGLQSLNIALGGSLIQDLPSQQPSELFHQQSERGLKRSEFSHSINVLPEARLRSIVGSEEMLTNSFHHQALKQVAEGLVVTAYAPDGVIEGAERPASRYLVAVQFHPEETAPHDEKSRKLFEAFVQVL